MHQKGNRIRCPVCKVGQYERRERGEVPDSTERRNRQEEVSQEVSSGSDSKESACNVEDLGLIHGLGDPLEKGMATHSSILAWRIPGTEEPGRIQTMGSQKVGHD